MVWIGHASSSATSKGSLFVVRIVTVLLIVMVRGRRRMGMVVVPVARSLMVKVVSIPIIFFVMIVRRVRGSRTTTAVFHLLPPLVVSEIIENARRMVETVNDFEHLQSLLVRHFLRISTKRDGPIFIVFEQDMVQHLMRHILDEDPLHLELSLPLVLRPHRARRTIIEWRHHFRDAAKMARLVHAKEEVHFAVDAFAFVKCVVQFSVPVICRAPNVVLNRPINVIFRIRFHHKKSSSRRRQIELDRIVIVFLLQLFE